MNPKPEWTTRLNPELERELGQRYGYTQPIHNAWFEPPTWSNHRAVVSLGIPECELQFVSLADDGTPIVCINRRPLSDRNVKKWICTACKIAAEQKAWISLGCDTAEQAKIAAKRIAKLLPQYHRVALERMYEVTSRERNNLS
jgi:hypothetical protein